MRRSRAQRSREALRRVETQNGGLLCPNRSPPCHVQHNGGAGWVEKPSVMLKHEREGF